MYFVCFCFILHSCCIIVSALGWIWWDWKLILRTYLPSVLWHWWLGQLTRKTVRDMTYNVFGGTLNLTHPALPWSSFTTLVFASLSLLQLSLLVAAYLVWHHFVIAVILQNHLISATSVFLSSPVSCLTWKTADRFFENFTGNVSLGEEELIEFCKLPISASRRSESRETSFTVWISNICILTLQDTEIFQSLDLTEVCPLWMLLL